MDCKSTIMDLLEEEYRNTLNDVASVKANTEEAEWQLKKLSVLGKELCDQKTSDLQADKAIEEQKNGMIKNILTGVGIIAPIVASSVWMHKTLKFEETGTITSRSNNFVGNIMRLFGGKK